MLILATAQKQIRGLQRAGWYWRPEIMATRAIDQKLVRSESLSGIG